MFERFAGSTLERFRGAKAFVALCVVGLFILPGCGSGTSTNGSPASESSTQSIDDSGGTTSPDPTSNPDPSAAVVVRRCPEAAEVRRVVGFSLKKVDLGEGDCAYLPPDRANSGISIGVVHPHNAFPAMTNLAAAKKESRFGGGTAESESADVNGGRITSFLKDTPQYGPGTFEAGQSIEGKTDAEAMRTCDFFALGTDGYPASVQAVAQKGGAYSYEGTVSRAEVCDWASATLALAIRK
jgi:hypothetical protein